MEAAILTNTSPSRAFAAHSLLDAFYLNKPLKIEALIEKINGAVIVFSGIKAIEGGSFPDEKAKTIAKALDAKVILYPSNGKLHILLPIV